MNWFTKRSEDSIRLIDSIFSIHIGGKTQPPGTLMRVQEQAEAKELDDDYQNFLEYRKTLVDVQLRSRTALDDRCILVCTTFLGLSLTLLQFKHGQLINPVCLLASVILITGSATVTLLSMYISTQLSESALKDLDAVCSIKKHVPSPYSLRLEKAIDIFHVIQILFLMVGIALFSFFALTNSSDQLFPSTAKGYKHMTEKEKDERLINHETGLKIPPPPPPKPIQKPEGEKTQGSKTTEDKK